MWTELLAFDVEQADFGVSHYIRTLGFTPEVVCLLIASPDIVLQHGGLEEDASFPPDFCSRHGHKGNETRDRQEWSRYQLRGLVVTLQQAGSRVYLSNFCCSLQDRFHREWVSDHPEAKVVFASAGRLPSLFVLARLGDGTYVRDYFARQLAQVCLDYGFDGWHGADCFGPHSPIFDSACCDDMIGQFIESGQSDLPGVVTAPSHDLPANLQKRMDWLWAHKRLEWISFQADRWADFWQVVNAALHAIGRKTAINSAWTRDPFQALYRYGVDYRKIAATGVDAIVVETVAGSIMLGTADRDYHYDYLAMLLHIKACVPDTPLIFLHPIKDVVENWDLLRHNAPMLEREIHALSSVYHTTAAGHLVRSVDGLLACLADGISSAEWASVDRHWQLALGCPPPFRTVGATLLWTDSILDGHLATYPTRRDCSAHYLTYRLMEQAAPIQATVRAEPDRPLRMDPSQPLLVLLPHLLSEPEKALLLAVPNPLIGIGPDFTGWPEPSFELADLTGSRPYYCRIYRSSAALAENVITGAATQRQTESTPIQAVAEPISFRQELPYEGPSDAFFQKSAALLRMATHSFSLENSRAHEFPPTPMQVSIMMTEQTPGCYRLVVKNSGIAYAHPRINVHRRIRSLQIRSSFPVTALEPDGSVFTLIVPPRGVVVLDLTVCAPI